MAASVIQNEKEIISLISSCKVCNVAMVDENEFLMYFHLILE